MQNNTCEEEIEDKKGFVEVARGVRDRLSRTSTIISQRSKRGSITPLNSSQSRLPLVSDFAQQDLEDPERVVDQIKEKAFYDRLAALNHTSPPIDEETEMSTIKSPIRRRSLFTPGLATRVPDDILRKPPPVPQRSTTQFDRDYYYNPNHSETSPLSALASLDLASHHRFSPVPRVSTPCDLEYSQLGGLRLGTLRITNGNASPVPRVRSPNVSDTQPSLEMRYQEDYFTASEGKASDDEESESLQMVARGRRGWDTEPVDIPESAHRRARLDAEKSERPLSSGTTIIRREGRSNDDSQMSQSASQDCSPGFTEAYRDEVDPTPATTNSATVIAEQYIAELPLTPFKDYFEPNWITNEFEDRNFDEGESLATSQPGNSTWTSFPSETERMHSMIGAHDTNRQMGQNYSPNGVPGCGSGPGLICSYTASGESTMTSRPVESGSSNTDVTKADSGYGSSSHSSTASMGSVKRKPVADHGRTQSSLPETVPSTLSSHISGPRDMPPRPSERLGSARDIAITTTTTVTTDQIQPSKRSSMLMVPKPKLLSFNSRSSAGHSAETITTLASTNTSFSSGSTGQRKLQKPRPKSLPPPVNRITVQGQRTLVELHIPPVPIDIAEKHADRLQRFPLLEHTFPSSHHTDLRENISDPLPVYVPIRFPSPTRSTEQSHSHSRDSNDIVVRKSDKSTHRSSLRRGYSFRSRSSSRTERRSSQQQLPGQCDVATAIADFGDVTESLGASPYDAARTAMWATPPADRNANLAHPHQMTVATPRAKSMIGMSGEQAAQLARMRSQDRQSSLSRSGRTTTRPTSLIVAASFDMPHTSSFPTRRSFDDRGGIPGKLPRPRSMYANVPPMPALPSPEQLQKREAEVSRSRSRGSQLATPYQVDEEQKAAVADLGWDEHRKVWAQRRKSAGDGLLPSLAAFGGSQNSRNPSRLSHQHFQPQQKSTSPTASNNTQYLDVPTPPTRCPPPPPVHGNDLSTSRNASTPPTRRPPPPPVHGTDLSTSRNGSTISLQSMKSTESNVQRLSGRYEGGLKFGYEPGLGVGGSAGTRNMKTGASRKSVEVSMGYGIDLSDVPIFVAPSS